MYMTPERQAAVSPSSSSSPMGPAAVAAITAGGQFLSSLFGGGEQKKMNREQLALQREGLAQNNQQFWANYGQGARGDALGAEKDLYAVRGNQDAQAHARAGSNALLPFRQQLIAMLAKKYGGTNLDFSGMRPTPVTQDAAGVAGAVNRMAQPAGQMYPTPETVDQRSKDKDFAAHLAEVRRAMGGGVGDQNAVAELERYKRANPNSQWRDGGPNGGY